MKYVVKMLGFGTAAILACAAGASAQQAETCALANSGSSIGPGIYGFNTTGSVSNQNDTVACAGENAATTDIWFKYTAGVTGIANVSATNCDVIFGATGAVYTQCGAAELVFSCDLCTQTMSFPVTSGQRYLIRVADYSFFDFAQGPATLNIAEVVPPAPTNNDCANAALLNTGPGTFAVDNYGATTDGAAIGCGSNAGGSDVWFEYVVQNTGSVTFLADQDRSITVLTGGCGGTVVGCDPFDGASAVAVSATAGTHLWVRVALRTGSLQAEGNTGSLNIAEVTPPGNDTCNSPEAHNGSFVSNYSMVGATAGGPAPGCGPVDNRRDVWFAYTCSTTGNVSIQTAAQAAVNQNLGNTIEVFASCASVSPIACGAPSSDPFQVVPTIRHWVAFAATAGTTYYVRVTSEISNTDTNTGHITLTEHGVVAGDSCAQAVSVTAGATVPCDNFGVRDDDARDLLPFNCTPTFVAHGSIWFVFTPSTSGIATFDVNDDTATNIALGLNRLDSVIEAYSGCAEGTPITCNDQKGISADDQDSYIAVPATMGVPIYVRIATKVSQFNNNFYRAGDLTVNLVPALANDACASAQPITPGNYQIDNRNATNHGTFTQCSFPNVPLKDLWYSWTSPGDGRAIVNTCGGISGTAFINLDTSLSVYEGSCSDFDLHCNENDDEAHACSSSASYIEFPAVAGTTYFFRVASASPDSIGRGWIKLEFDPDCAADFNGVNGVTVQDIFDFLTAWLAGNSSANFNGVNGVTVQDIFDFLTAWLAGC